MRTASREQCVQQHLSNSLDAGPKRLFELCRSDSALNHNFSLPTFGVDAEVRIQLKRACCGLAVV